MEKTFFTDKNFIKSFFTKDERFHDSHGCDCDDFLGVGMLYYTLAYMYRARKCVCLGSGSGFVPRIMRQAQLDLGMKNFSQTILVDANLPELGWGKPDYFEQPSFFTKQYSDVVIIKKLTLEAVNELDNIDYLHIDADHRYESVKSDYEAYLPKMKKGTGIITLHDSVSDNTGVPKFIKEINEPNVAFALGGGTTLVKI